MHARKIVGGAALAVALSTVQSCALPNNNPSTRSLVQSAVLDLRFAGALEFGPDGVLFVGDNIGGAIHAFELGEGQAAKEDAAIDIDSIDAAVAKGTRFPQCASTSR